MFSRKMNSASILERTARMAQYVRPSWPAKTPYDIWREEKHFFSGFYFLFSRWKLIENITKKAVSKKQKLESVRTKYCENVCMIESQFKLAMAWSNSSYNRVRITHIVFTLTGVHGLGLFISVTLTMSIVLWVVVLWTIGPSLKIKKQKAIKLRCFKYLRSQPWQILITTVYKLADKHIVSVYVNHLSKHGGLVLFIDGLSLFLIFWGALKMGNVGSGR